MSAYVIYVAGGALATSFMANNRWLRGLGWLLLAALIAMVAF